MTGLDPASTAPRARAFQTLLRTGTLSDRLTPQETALVDALCAAAERGLTLTRAELGKLAGYGQTHASNEVGASRALARERVRNAIKERAMQSLAMDAPHAIHVIRQTRAAKGTNQYAAAVDTLKLIGFGAGEAQIGGPAIALQLVIGGETGNALAMRLSRPAQVIDAQGESEAAHSLPEGGKASSRPRAKRDPSPGPKPKRGAKAPRGSKRAGQAPARGKRTISPRKPAVSPGGTSEGGEG